MRESAGHREVDASVSGGSQRRRKWIGLRAGVMRPEVERFAPRRSWHGPRDVEDRTGARISRRRDGQAEVAVARREETVLSPSASG
ncbi:hypothetical protein [Brachybacterium sacelli]|uniref:hypothetical protein n=1 Tax=Brachybacterium sacelli TaxID=173364 RepID=UPI003619C9F9